MALLASGPSKEYVYAGSKLIATVEPTAVNGNDAQFISMYYWEPCLNCAVPGNCANNPPPGNWLAIGSGSFAVSDPQEYSVRVIMKNTGSTTWSSGSNYYLGSQNPANNEVWGAGKKRIALPNSVPPTGSVTFELDYFLARYYSSAQGRFTSADQPFAGQHEGDPQSWNLFAYGRNNPLIYIDATGHDYNVFDKDGNLIGQVKDPKDLPSGFVFTHSSDDGKILYFERGYRAEYFEGDKGKATQVYAFSDLTPLANGVIGELDRRAAPSLKAIQQ